MPEFSGMIRDGVSVRKLRLSAAEPVGEDVVEQDQQDEEAEQQAARHRELEADLEQARVAPRLE